MVIVVYGLWKTQKYLNTYLEVTCYLLITILPEIRREAGEHVPERDADLNAQKENPERRQKPHRIFVHSRHVIDNGDPDDGGDDLDGDLDDLLADEVDVGPVHAVEVLPEEDRKLAAENRQDREDVVKGGVGDLEEEDETGDRSIF